MTTPISTDDLSPAERDFLDALHRLDFGTITGIRVLDGRLILSPRPTCLRHLKFGAAHESPKHRPEKFQLKVEMVQFIQFVRAVHDGEIRRLSVRHGLPVAVEFVQRPRSTGELDND